MEHGRTRLLSILSVLAVILGLVSCQSRSGPNSGAGASPAASLHELSITGKLLWKDGTPLASQSARYAVTLGGTNLFAEGQNGCSRSDPHMQAAVSLNLPSSADGVYRAQIPLDQARSVTNPACGVSNLTTSNVDTIRIVAEIPANSETCPKYCSVSQDGTPTEVCEKDCESGNRVLIATQTLTRDTLQSQHQGMHQDLVFAREGPAIGQGSGPDLVVDRDAALSSVHLSEEEFKEGDCAIVEECVAGPGKRKLLRFDGDIINLGSGPLVLGSPIGNPQFEYSACHDHYHLRNMMLYELVDPITGNAIVSQGSAAVGRKQGFCMMDIDSLSATAGDPIYTCDNQGLSPGWEDTYDNSLDCQWLDVTGVAPGKYKLRITVNPAHLFEDSDWSNNSADLPVEIPAS